MTLEQYVCILYMYVHIMYICIIYMYIHTRNIAVSRCKITIKITTRF